MSWTRSLRALLGRVDVRLSLAVGGCAGLLMSVALLILLAYAVLEALEEKEAELAREADVVAAHLDSLPLRPEELRLPRDLVARTQHPDGRVLPEVGTWPASGRAIEVGVWSGLTASARDFLIRALPLPDGGTLELALPLRHFVHERGELFVAVARILLGSLVATSAFGVFGARRALGPLRQATQAVQRVDAKHLDARIPVRGAGDDVDALAAAINQVLERLEWAFGRMAGFSADVAHELRTPVNRVLNCAEVALLAPAGGSTHHDALVAVRDTAEEMRRLIEQLLLLARGEEGRLPLKLETVDVAERVCALIALYAPVAESSGQALDLVSSPARAQVDLPLFYRALGNLIENALQHAPRGSTIRVTVNDTYDGVQVIVEDSGPGLAEAERERIFERFVQLDPSRRGGGAGLGLAIARMIARLHGGDLRAGHSPLGGAEFRITLPGEMSTSKTLAPGKYPLAPGTAMAKGLEVTAYTHL